MELDQIEKRLRKWKAMHAGQAMHAGLNKAYDKLHALTEAMPGCALMAPMFDLWDAYTAAVGESVGDRGQWLQWFEAECYMGRNPTEVVLSDGREVRIRTLRQLARLIADGDAA